LDDLILAPPVCTPSEPPSGALLLAAALCARGRDAALLDLSLEAYHRWLSGAATPGPRVQGALHYLTEGQGGGYDPHPHRSASGSLHNKLRHAAQAWPGWRFSLMDVEPPLPVHDPDALAELLAHGEHPFRALWREVLDPVLERERPARVLVSLAYLSQLPAALDLVAHLRRRGIQPVVGGSLPNSLAETGGGLDALARHFGHLELGDGASLLGADLGEPFLQRLVWPRLLSPLPYLSARPIVPYTLSTGCFWRRCLFCPDRSLAFRSLPESSLAAFLDTLPPALRARRPVLHLLDSALPPAGLRRALPVIAQGGFSFYGFARPQRALLRDGLLEQAAQSGCLMLQLGVESGSAALLQRYQKGFAPEEAESVLREAAAVGIRTYGYLLFGLPGEGPQERAQTLDLLIRNAGALDFLNLSSFNLPLRCELNERAAEFGIELGDPPPGDALRIYRPFRVAGDNPRRGLRRFLNEELGARPELRPALLRTPRWLRAAHLALLRLPGRRDP